MLFFPHPVFTVIENGTEHYHEQEIKADSLQVRRSHLFLEHLLALVLSCLFFPNLYLHCGLANKLKCETVNCHSVAPLQTFGHLFFLFYSNKLQLAFTVMMSRAALVAQQLGHSAEYVASPACIRLNPASPCPPMYLCQTPTSANF